MVYKKHFLQNLRHMFFSWKNLILQHFWAVGSEGRITSLILVIIRSRKVNVVVNVKQF